MRLSWTKTNTLICAAMLAMTSNSHACTNFRVTATDGTVVIARSMEFAIDMKSNLRTSNRGRVFTSTAPDGAPGMTWKAQYGYVFLDGMGIDVALDGMNEAGLSIQDLLFPNYAEYQTVPAGHDNQALNYINFADWILSNFKSIDEVKQALSNVYVFGQNIQVPGVGNVTFPIHYEIDDASGKSIVVEYVKGKLNVYDNKIGVMTNSPAYSWHLTNQSNYVNLLPTNPKPVMDNGVTFVATGQGAGMMGLPGDISPPSRFVKVVTLTRVAYPTPDAAGALNLAEHIINNVDIPLGLAREQSTGNYTNETTQWVVFKDLTHKVFYYRTYNNMTLRSVDLNNIDFSANAARLKMPINGNPYVQSMTAEFQKTTQPQVTVQTAQGGH